MQRTIYEHQAEGFDPDQIHRLIRGRRTVKPATYRDETIPRPILDEILENANWAPNHGNTEPWRFVVFAGAGREKLAELLPQLYLDVTPEAERKPGKTDKLQANPRQASHVIALILQRQPSGKIPEIEEVEAVACAVQNMALTAYAYGIGSFWSTGPMIYTDQAKAAFHIKGNDQLLGFLYLGYPGQGFPAGSRQPVEAKVEWVE